eukprot:CAMPEP_0202450596 /NCGR_PEP_ID=MMETSP1360-20130828/9186_1 /ASSEMBLY_ACC=CAM_ASM_000848 /TAXON_ID=515479 /ORGANISM="Licmophora paradoxa, Strain CCMP2313" /LENGTH=222 /DNA_ID=CAMNT_0049068929 /DNA_START=91 /DNA_END=759 /DNA_ORIENTATION=-
MPRSSHITVLSIAIALALVASTTSAFVVPGAALSARRTVSVFETATTEPAAAEATDNDDIPTNLPSDIGMDYIPLATMLATGQFEEADQFTRDALIKLAGSKDAGRDFVYFTEVKRIPSTDLATIERLWLKFSKGKFGYSVQKKKWSLSKGDFEVFCQKIGWTTTDGEIERKKKWFGASEFTYDIKAPEGHLPLTSALRGTSLVRELLTHPVWENDDWKKEP